MVPRTTELYGKKVSDLQSNIKISRDGKLTGISKYVKSYPSFSSIEEEQKGNYLALEIEDAKQGRTVSVGIDKMTKLDSDGQIVLILKHGNTKPIKVQVENGPSYEIDLSGLTITPEN